MDMYEIPVEQLCINCRNAEGKPLHTCPYLENHFDDQLTKCNCCDKCKATCK